jgi:hypothetical protein
VPLCVDPLHIIILMYINYKPIYFLIKTFKSFKYRRNSHSLILSRPILQIRQEYWNGISTLIYFCETHIPGDIADISLRHVRPNRLETVKQYILLLFALHSRHDCPHISLFLRTKLNVHPNCLYWTDFRFFNISDTFE